MGSRHVDAYCGARADREASVYLDFRAGQRLLRGLQSRRSDPLV